MCVECLKREVLDLASKQQSASESSVTCLSVLIYSTDASVFAFIKKKSYSCNLVAG